MIVCILIYLTLIFYKTIFGTDYLHSVFIANKSGFSRKGLQQLIKSEVLINPEI